ncbi:MAG: hypothetical protein AVDCRST_MAG04-947 [uncultured Acetobacteraceae bacterium]|jgi:hypothetical protein|uniref:Glycine zipper domain-containing protein n=1 Tax=uncultured Acetobacteraceae bacterium TaxID=169975 RepID=A0A6J4HL19_9PROT|nr:MAG: hypothetical protein AVDCRST_MAG04-947 [uncultured Acetobacteraceae bacterium]
MTWKLVGAAALVLAAAACGTREPDRTGGGAAAGAATGAAVGALGGPVGLLAGAAIGAGAGAATGAATSPSDVNLGRPPWSNPEVRTPLGDNRRGRNARRARGEERQTAERRREPRDERDRAYMGGGMVGTGTTAPADGTSSAGSGNQPRAGGTSQAR